MANRRIISVDPEIGTLPRADLLVEDDRIGAEDAEAIDAM